MKHRLFFSLKKYEKFAVMCARSYLKNPKFLFIATPEKYGINYKDVLDYISKFNCKVILSSSNRELARKINARVVLLNFGISEGDREGKEFDSLFYADAFLNLKRIEMDLVFNEKTCIMSDRVYEISCNNEDIIDYDRYKEVASLRCVLFFDEASFGFEKDKKQSLTSKFKGKVFVYDADFGMRIF